MDMRWLGYGGVVIASLLCVPAARAAEITDVADAADTVRIGDRTRDELLDVYLDDGVEVLSESGKITREPLEGASAGCTATNASACGPVDELRYGRMTYAYRLRGQIGIYQDLAFTFGWSYIARQSLEFHYADGVTAANSTVDSSDPAVGTLFRNDFASRHQGSSKLEFGLKWAPLSDERDESKPMWVLGFNWATPWTEKTYDPTVRATASHPGAVGDGVHYLTFSMALSKRLGRFGSLASNPEPNRRGYLDPYVEVAAVVPVAQSGKTLPALDPDQERPYAHVPSREARLAAGFEVVPVEDLQAQRKLSVDLGLRGSYFTAGRNYSILSDPLGRVTYTEPYLYIGGELAVYAQVAQALRIKAGGSVGYTSGHFITGESAAAGNPYYCGHTAGDACAPAGTQFSFDEVGYRFRDEEHVTLGGFLSAMLTL